MKIVLVEENVFATFVDEQVIIAIKPRELKWKYVLPLVIHRELLPCGGQEVKRRGQQSDRVFYH